MVRDAVPLGECARALVVKLRHHGDVLLAAPVPSVLKAHAPKLEVDALVYDDTAPMLAGHPALAELHCIGRKWRSLRVWQRLRHERALLRALRRRKYDLLVHLTEHPRGAWLARLLGVRYAVAPNETPFIDQIIGRAASKPINLAGQLSLKELGALTARARLFIGVDSMPMHLAAAMGTPTVALFGPSSEDEWAPWNVEQRVVTSTHSCRPCRVDGCGGGKVSECLTLLP